MIRDAGKWGRQLSQTQWRALGAFNAHNCVCFFCLLGWANNEGFLRHESPMRRLDDMRCGAPAAACGLVWKYKEAYWTGAVFERGDVTARLDWGLQVAGALSGVLILGYGFRDGRVATLERDNNTTQ